MGWIATLLPWLIKYGPTLLAMLSALFGAGAGVSYHQSWQRNVLEMQARGVSAAPDSAVYWQYVGGSAGGGLILAGVMASAQSRQSAAHDALEREEDEDAVDLDIKKSARIGATRARQLKAQLARLSPEDRDIVLGGK